MTSTLVHVNLFVQASNDPSIFTQYVQAALNARNAQKINKK
jgi:hypothetical protein